MLSPHMRAANIPANSPQYLLKMRSRLSNNSHLGYLEDNMQELLAVCSQVEAHVNWKAHLGAYSMVHGEAFSANANSQGGSLDSRLGLPQLPAGATRALDATLATPAPGNDGFAKAVSERVVALIHERRLVCGRNGCNFTSIDLPGGSFARHAQWCRGTPDADQLHLAPGTKSGFKCVYPSRHGGKWDVRVRDGGPMRHLGRFNTAREAAVHLAEVVSRGSLDNMRYPKRATAVEEEEGGEVGGVEVGEAEESAQEVVNDDNDEEKDDVENEDDAEDDADDEEDKKDDEEDEGDDGSKVSALWGCLDPEEDDDQSEYKPVCGLWGCQKSRSHRGICAVPVVESSRTCRPVRGVARRKKKKNPTRAISKVESRFAKEQRVLLHLKATVLSEYEQQRAQTMIENFQSLLAQNLHPESWLEDGSVSKSCGDMGAPITHGMLQNVTAKSHRRRLDRNRNRNPFRFPRPLWDSSTTQPLPQPPAEAGPPTEPRPPAEPQPPSKPQPPTKPRQSGRAREEGVEDTREQGGGGEEGTSLCLLCEVVCVPYTQNPNMPGRGLCYGCYDSHRSNMEYRGHWWVSRARVHLQERQRALERQRAQSSPDSAVDTTLSDSDGDDLTCSSYAGRGGDQESIGESGES